MSNRLTVDVVRGAGAAGDRQFQTATAITIAATAVRAENAARLTRTSIGFATVTCAISILASAMSGTRRSGSFSRHRRNSLTTPAGVSAGSRLQSGAPARTAASV